MSTRMTYLEKEARKKSRNKTTLIINEIAEFIRKLPFPESDKWVYKSSMTIGQLAKHLSQKFQISVSNARGIVSFYVSSREDLFVTKGRHGGIQKSSPWRNR